MIKKTAKNNVEKLWKYCKNSDESFFILSLGCLMNAVNSVDEFKRRIIDDKVIEYDYLEATSPIMNVLLWVNKIPDKLNLLKIMEPDHILPLKMDYNVRSSILPINRP